MSFWRSCDGNWKTYLGWLLGVERAGECVCVRTQWGRGGGGGAAGTAPCFRASLVRGTLTNIRTLTVALARALSTSAYSRTPAACSVAATAFTCLYRALQPHEFKSPSVYNETRDGSLLVAPDRYARWISLRARQCKRWKFTRYTVSSTPTPKVKPHF